MNPHRGGAGNEGAGTTGACDKPDPSQKGEDESEAGEHASIKILAYVGGGEVVVLHVVLLSRPSFVSEDVTPDLTLVLTQKDQETLTIDTNTIVIFI